MRFGRTSNPLLDEGRLRNLSRTFDYTGPMTLEGAIGKTGILLLLTVLSAAWVWRNAFAGANVMPYVMGGAILGFITAIVTSFKPQWSPYSAPVYAVLEGFVVGGVSAMYAAFMGGVVMKAVLLTFGIFFMMLFAYRTKMIVVTDKFKRFLMISMGGIFVFYLLSWILSFFGVPMMSIFDGGLLGIGISLFIVVIASLSLLWDFDSIEQMALMGAPKYMEWYGGFSLMVTIIWLYFEILRLVAMLSRD